MSDEPTNPQPSPGDPYTMPASPPYHPAAQPPQPAPPQQPAQPQPGQPATTAPVPDPAATPPATPVTPAASPYGQWPPPPQSSPQSPPPPAYPPYQGGAWYPGSSPAPPPAHAQTQAQPGMSKRAIVAVVLLFALLSSGIGVAIGASLANSHGGTTATSFPTAAPSPSSSDSNSSSSSGSQSQALPAPSNGSSSGSLSTDDIAKKVDTSLVDINVTFSAGEGAGTGMILTSNGLVLTNNHVIANATKIEVQSVDSGDTYSASVLGYDITDDVALIQLKDASGLTPVSVGNSDKLSAGDDVVALGNALGKGGTPSVAEGTVSALDQSIQVQDDNGTTSTLAGLIETSAQLQPGDSGGAMVDSTGTVIGMNAAASTSRRGRTTNDSFAIPINSALDIAKNIENGQGSSNIHIGDRALLGVQIQGDSPTVADVESGSPADKAGIQAGDTITNVDGTSINSATDIVSALDSHHPGDGVKVTWTDGNGNQQTATVQLESGPPA